MRYNELNESQFLTNEDEIYIWMNDSVLGFNPDRLTIESDGLVYTGNLDLCVHVQRLEVNFKSVSGYFDCDTTNITDLKGCPQIVGGYFSFGDTNVTSLKYCPKSVGIGFSCGNIKVKDTKEYRYALYSEIGGYFFSDIEEINEIINTYSGSINRKYWAHAINLLSRVKI